MLKRKTFDTILDAIRYMKKKSVSYRNLIYIANKNGICELVYKK